MRIERFITKIAGKKIFEFAEIEALPQLHHPPQSHAQLLHP
jgi:hypothetical protein